MSAHSWSEMTNSSLFAGHAPLSNSAIAALRRAGVRCELTEQTRQAIDEYATTGYPSEFRALLRAKPLGLLAICDMDPCYPVSKLVIAADGAAGLVLFAIPGIRFAYNNLRSK